MHPVAGSTDSVNASPGELVVLVVLGAVWAFIGFRMAEHDRRRLGRSPWGLPAGVWSLLWFLGGIITVVVYLAARSREIRRARAAGVLPPVPGVPPARTAPPPTTAADLFPAYPRPAGGRPAAATPGAPVLPLGPVHATSEVPPTGPPSSGSDQPADTGARDTPGAGGASPAATPASAPAPTPAPQGAPGREISPPHWHPDPSGRFHYRWWNGTEWTSTVSLNGQVLIDTSPDQRIGPYT